MHSWRWAVERGLVWNPWAAGQSLPQPPYLISQMNETPFQLRKAAPVLALLCLHGDLRGEHGQD